MRTLLYGSRGMDVRLLQLALKRSGRYVYALDGIFGTRTLNALRRFQTSEGLTPDGIAGPRTRAALEPRLLGVRRIKLRAGDSYYRLAKRYGVSAAAVAAANPGLDPENLPIGAEVVVPLGFRLVPRDTPMSSLLAEYIIRGLALRYPFITVETIGASALGRPIYAVKLGGGERTVSFNAAHHANEWITSTLVLSFAEELLSAYVEGGSAGGFAAGELWQAAGLCLLPLVNPDGVDLVTGALGAGSEGYARVLSIAEGWPDIPFPSGWKANAAGVDLNLNYPADWEEAKRIKYAQGFTSPAPRDYVGEAPLCAPEARAVYDWTRRNDFALTVSYHTQGGEIYWRYKDIEPEGGERIGRLLAEASGYALAEVPEEASNAGYRDWFILSTRRPGYTVEAGRGTNPLPLSDLPRLIEANHPLMAQAMLAAALRRNDVCPSGK